MNHCLLTDMRAYRCQITVLYKYMNREFLHEPGILHHAIWKFDRLSGLVVGVPGYRTEMYCVSCEVRTEFICYVEESRLSL
jgi:hypothetical protein